MKHINTYVISLSYESNNPSYSRLARKDKNEPEFSVYLSHLLGNASNFEFGTIRKHIGVSLAS